MNVLEYLILVLRVIAGRSQGVSYETREDAERLADSAAAGPTIRARRAAEGIAGLAPRRHRRNLRNVPRTGTATDTPALHDHAGRWRGQRARAPRRRPTTSRGQAGPGLYVGTIMGMVTAGNSRALSQGRIGKKKVLAEDGRASSPRRCTVSAPRTLRMLQPTPPGPRYCGSGGW